MIAHFGHWYFQLLYAVPVAAIIGALRLQRWREERRARSRRRQR
ncbi:MAG: hypothetical protein NVSMB51_00780 [Solirubrobacteraceae bacterium]